ncbi:MAG: hypothetical protein PHV79_03225, partial [Clostridia bacterium]|nr:hypothetical protein [Clostridia bacterium]
DIAILGRRLYQILLENGLNESEKINPARLISKVDGFVYEENYDRALEILEVVDSTEPCPHIDKDGERIYYVSTLIEAAIIWQILLSPAPTNLNWTISPRCVYLSLKAQILIMDEKYKEAEDCANLLLKLNPASFDAYFLLSKIYKRNNLEKFKKFLFNAYDVCYTSEQMASFLKEISAYYGAKKDFLTAYAAMYASSFFSDVLLVQNELFALEIEINKTQIGKFVPPKPDEIKQILKKENIPYHFKENIFNLVSETYLNILVNDYNNEKLVNMSKAVVDDVAINAPDLSKDIEKIAKKIRDGKKGKV